MAKDTPFLVKYQPGKLQMHRSSLDIQVISFYLCFRITGKLSNQEDLFMDILIAEKSVAFGELIEYQCAGLGYGTRLVHDGREALLELKTKKFHLLLTDLLLPFYTGLEIIHFIHQSGWQKPPRKIILTQITNEQTVRKAFSLGIDDYITKPLDMDFLMHRITKLLQYDEGT